MSTQLFNAGYICRHCRTRIARQNHRFASSEARRRATIPDGPVRTRFAPSPTGYLHFGSIRTALFNYLIAKRTNGKFLLRIEDTDQKRTIQGAEERILNDLRWLGLRWDEGPEVGGPYGPYRQSERSALYKAHSEELIESGHAYRCFCSAETLQKKGQQRSQSGLATMYDRTCYHLSAEESKARVAYGEKYTVRLRAPEKPVAYNDIVGGPYIMSEMAARRAAAQGVYDDFILIKQDGLPTYHFANVVDDHHMKITHVIRGVEWQISTPKHLNLYDAFGWVAPSFGHIGLLLNEDGTKMSKRDKTFDLHMFKKDGVLPEALINFLALFGWSHAQRSDYMSLKDLEHNFDLNLSNTNPTVSLAKLWFLAPKHAMKRVENGGEALDEMLDNFCSAVQTVMAEEFAEREKLEEGLNPSAHRGYVKRVLIADAKNYVSAVDFARTHSYFFLKSPVISETIAERKAKAVREALCSSLNSAFRDGSVDKRLLPAPDETNEYLQDLYSKATDDAIKAVTQTQSETGERIKKKEFWQILRVLLTGGQKGPSLVETMEILGLERVIERLSSQPNYEDNVS
ncbi:glutamate-tRNA ligase [Verruconis gallopava]|uniref:Glutamate--tRNA ligase, mitochondrial n=1 Tax=Verruconis gallopava TaxID=253628 RepID=A0A0D1YSM4_9PEZI|nr:glutamate-tRNA ligase [Verruconis gallopava]KIW03627.1 glutamate-tRNA ligase [Verruconis gallopava]